MECQQYENQIPQKNWATIMQEKLYFLSRASLRRKPIPIFKIKEMSAKSKQPKVSNDNRRSELNNIIKSSSNESLRSPFIVESSVGTNNHNGSDVHLDNLDTEDFLTQITNQTLTIRKS